MPFIDITGLQTLEEAIRNLQKRGVNVILSGANSRVRGKLYKAGIIDIIGEKNHFHTFEEAIQFLKEHLSEPGGVQSMQKVAVSDPV